MNIADITKIVESAVQPALLGADGKRVFTECKDDLATYFNHLAISINALELGQLAADYSDKGLARDHAILAVTRVVRHLTPALTSVLQLNIYTAMTTADAQTLIVAKEDATSQLYDKVGLTAQEAADYAAKRAATLVTGINNTTRDLIADAVGDGIEEQLGVAGTGRRIREIVEGMSVDRANLIATTEMNDAMSEADLRKIQRLGYYKRVVLGPDPCEICQENEDAGAIPADDLFPSGDLRTPFHPRCICAIVGARAPEEAV